MSSERIEMNAEAEVVLDAAVQKIIGAALAAIQADPHQWSTRPCPTCRAVTAITGIKFGCCAYAANRIDQ